MPVYCVSYDLINEKDYPKIHAKLKEYPGWAHALDSTWFISTDDSAPQIRDNLMKATDNDDQIIVIEVIKHWGTTNISKGVTDWLKKHL